MSSLVLMRILESAPARYDDGMRLLTLGGWGRAHEVIADAAVEGPGAKVLEIGCGTGALTERLLERGARVVAIDQSPEMLDRARTRLRGVAEDRLTLDERTASEIDGFAPGEFDAVAASLVFSEMSPSERAWVLRKVADLLRPGGRLVVGDEVRPSGPIARLLHRVVRIPLSLLAWVVTGSTTRAIPYLAAEIAAAGLQVSREVRSQMGTFAVVVAERPRGGAERPGSAAGAE